MNRHGIKFGRRSIFAILLIAVVSFIMGSCEYPSGAQKGNTLPTTRISNVPANDTIAQYISRGAIPEVTLYWVGDDPDGFVVAYQYRWTTLRGASTGPTSWRTLLNVTTIGSATLDTIIQIHGTPGSVFRIYNFFATIDPIDLDLTNRILDSIGTGRPFAVPYKEGIIPGDSVIGANPLANPAPTKGTFIFLSPADSNMHRFEVAAIDNNDAVDPNPAQVHFWTLRSPAPTVLFNTSPPNDQMVLRYATDRFPGLVFTFSSLDPSTFDQVYRWSVDDTLSWSNWSESPQALVTAIYFKPIATGTHTMYVQCRNRWGVRSQIASRNFTAIVPEIDDPNYPKKILIINNNRVVGAGPIDSNLVKTFFAGVMSGLGIADTSYLVWTVVSPKPGLPPNSFPPRNVFSKHLAVLVTSDQHNPVIGAPFIDVSKQQLLREYLNIGGNLLYSGTPNIAATLRPYEPWATDIFHTVPTTFIPLRQNTQLDFVASKGILGYPNIRIDTTKVRADSGYAMRNIALNLPAGFGETISYFDSKTNNEQFEDQPLGVRFISPPGVPPARRTYSVVHFGVPLYFAQQSDVVEAVRRALQDVGFLP